MRLVVDTATFAYPGAAEPVLRGVSFSVGLGERLAVMGPSGTGKSTLLALLGGVLRPDAGQVSVVASDGTVLRSQDVTSWVLQSVNLLPDRAVLDNARLGALADGAPLYEATERACAALGAVGLTGFEHRSVRDLSGGEAQRVVVARALASRRPFILADEPTGQLDTRSTAVVLDALFTHTLGRGIVVVTHDPDVAARCDTTWHLRTGVLTLSESP